MRFPSPVVIARGQRLVDTTEKVTLHAHIMSYTTQSNGSNTSSFTEQMTTLTAKMHKRQINHIQCQAYLGLQEPTHEAIA